VPLEAASFAATIELVTTNFFTPAFSACRKTFKEPSMADYQYKKKLIARFKGMPSRFQKQHTFSISCGLARPGSGEAV
jgi:hypothetical protein